MRKKIDISQYWKFFKGDITSSHDTDFDDSLWEKVNLPHNVETTPINSSGCRNYQGVCRYRKSFYLEKSNTEEKVLLTFDGAMQILEVWLNGTKLQVHYCGYTPAVYDITSYLKYDQDNQLSVRLDNSNQPDSPPGRPQSCLDFTYDGGLYKKAYITRIPYLHVTNPIEENITAGGGIFVHYEDVNKKNAKVFIKTHIKNISCKETVFKLSHTLFNKANLKVVTKEKIFSLKANSSDHFINVLEVSNPELWDSFNPNLYTLKTQIQIENNIIDEIDTKIGIRSFKFTKQGFYINSKKITMSGANYHMTFPHIGNAMSDNLLRRDARKLREAGMLSLRSHYPFPEAFIDECNKIGIALIISNPGWQYFKEGIFEERAYQNMRDIVRLLRNHPSIILWEPILNESKGMTVKFQNKIKNIVHEEYPYDPCYTASDSGHADIAYKSFDPGMFDPKMVRKHPTTIDEATWIRQTFDQETIENNKELIEEAKKLVLNKPRWIREYGDCPDNFTDQNSSWRIQRVWGEDMMIRQVNHMILGKCKEYLTSYLECCNDEGLCGFGVWPGIEHNRGYHMNPCFGGFLDLFRIPKYSFYFYKSQQSPDVNIENVSSGPMVYIANSWSKLSPEDITVFSNCEKVRLYHNNVLVEEKYPDDIKIPHPPFTFKNNFYYGRERSEIRVEGIIDNKVVAADLRKSPGVTTNLFLYADDEGIPLVADGSDLMVIRCEARDDNGFVVPLTFDNHEIRFDIEGEATIVGENIKHTELGITCILIKSTNKAGRIKIKAQNNHPQSFDRAPFRSGCLEIESIVKNQRRKI